MPSSFSGKAAPLDTDNGILQPCDRKAPTAFSVHERGRASAQVHAPTSRGIDASIELMDARQFDTVQGLPGRSQRTAR